MTCYSDTERKFSQDCPGSHYYELLAKTRLPPSLYISAFKYNNSQLDIFKACEIVPMSRVRSDEICDPLDMSGPINIARDGGRALTLGAISWIPSTSNICLIGQISHNWSNIWKIIKIFSMYGKVFPIMFFFRVISDCEAHHLVFSISNLSSLECCCRSLSIFCYLKSKMSKDDQLS